MAVDLEVRGAEQFIALSKALKHAGKGQLRKDLNSGIRVAVKPLVAKTRSAAKDQLPSSGGLAQQVAKEPQRVQVRTGAKTAGVRLGVQRKRGAARSTNRGRLRHPVFGNRDVWVTQSVPPGWFDDTIKRDVRRIRQEVEGVLDTIAKQIVNDARRRM